MDNNEFHESSFKSHSFFMEVGESKIIYRILQMKNSLFIYIGDNAEQTLDTMGVSFPIRDNVDKVTSAGIMGDLIDDSSCELAAKLAKRLKKPVFISCNVAMDRFVQPKVEGRLIEEIKNNPNMF